MFGRRSGGERRVSAGFGGASPGPGGAAKASWNLRFDVGLAVVAVVGGSSASDGGSGGEMMDWMRNWEAIVTAVGSPQGTL
jgi:hypothetical protein